MKREDVIELLVKSGLIEPNYIHRCSVISEFYQFAKLVEQAALERAAKHLRELGKVNMTASEETIDDDNAVWHEHAALVYSRSADLLDKLKDSND